MSNNYQTRNTSGAAAHPEEAKSDVTAIPEAFAHYQYAAMKNREADLTELPDHADFIASVLKAKRWDFPYAENPAKERVECRLNYDGSIKTCVLTGHRFIAPVPMAFFYEGDLEKPVCPHHALTNGFVMDHLSFFSVCWALCNPEDLRHWLPMAYKWAEQNDQTWIMDYGQFCSNPGDVIDDYFDMHLTDIQELVELRKRGEPLPRVNGIHGNSADQADITKQQ